MLAERQTQADAFVDPGRILRRMEGSVQLTGGQVVDRLLARKQPAARWHFAPLVGFYASLVALTDILLGNVILSPN